MNNLLLLDLMLGILCVLLLLYFSYNYSNIKTAIAGCDKPQKLCVFCCLTTYYCI